MKAQQFTSKEFKRILKNNGYVLVRQKGDHLIYKHPQREKIITITSKDLNMMIARRLIKENNLEVK